jgi:hypothetical protein
MRKLNQIIAPAFLTLALSFGFVSCDMDREYDGDKDFDRELEHYRTDFDNEISEIDRDIEEIDRRMEDDSIEEHTRHEYAEIKNEYKRHRDELRARSQELDNKTEKEWKEFKTDMDSWWQQTKTEVSHLGERLDRIGEENKRYDEEGYEIED